MSCLFNSLSYFISSDSNTIRQTICDYLQENKPIIDGISTHEILSMENNNYIQHMRNSSTWGGAIEISAACNLWNVKIIVYDIRTQQRTAIEFIPITCVAERTIELEWSGGHYEPKRF